MYFLSESFINNSITDFLLKLYDQFTYRVVMSRVVLTRRDFVVDDCPLLNTGIIIEVKYSLFKFHISPIYCRDFSVSFTILCPRDPNGVSRSRVSCRGPSCGKYTLRTLLAGDLRTLRPRKKEEKNGGWFRYEHQGDHRVPKYFSQEVVKCYIIRRETHDQLKKKRCPCKNFDNS